MLKRLKRQFVLITCALTGFVLVCVFCLNIYGTLDTQHHLVNTALSRGLDDDLDHMPTLGMREMRGPGGQGEGANMLALAVDVSSQGVVIKSSRSPVVISSDMLTQVVDAALDSDQDKGTMGDIHVAWARRFYVEDDGTGSYDPATAVARIVIVDTSALDSALSAQVQRSVLIAVAAMVALFFIANYLASMALKPVAQAWDAQRRFVADASHELKTPLAVIIANTQILMHDDAIPDESKRWVEGTLDESERMKGLVGELLELARADERRDDKAIGAAVMSDFDLSEMVDAAALEFDALAFERGCLIESTIEPAIQVHGDREGLERTIKIFIENACKYAAAGSTIQVALAREQGHPTLRVTNFGPIIDPEDLPHVFERFYRSDKARARGTGGFGLGLAIAKGIVDAHDGKIWVTSSEEAGTTFAFSL